LQQLIRSAQPLHPQLLHRTCLPRKVIEREVTIFKKFQNIRKIQ
jgi:hypothetical protein